MTMTMLSYLNYVQEDTSQIPGWVRHSEKDKCRSQFRYHRRPVTRVCFIIYRYLKMCLNGSSNLIPRQFLLFPFYDVYMLTMHISFSEFKHIIRCAVPSQGIGLSEPRSCRDGRQESNGRVRRMMFLTPSPKSPGDGRFF